MRVLSVSVWGRVKWESQADWGERLTLMHVMACIVTDVVTSCLNPVGIQDDHRIQTTTATTVATVLQVLQASESDSTSASRCVVFPSTTTDRDHNDESRHGPRNPRRPPSSRLPNSRIGALLRSTVQPAPARDLTTSRRARNSPRIFRTETARETTRSLMKRPAGARAAARPVPSPRASQVARPPRLTIRFPAGLLAPAPAPLPPPHVRVRGESEATSEATLTRVTVTRGDSAELRRSGGRDSPIARPRSRSAAPGGFVTPSPTLGTCAPMPRSPAIAALARWAAAVALAAATIVAVAVVNDAAATVTVGRITLHACALQLFNHRREHRRN